MLLNLNLNCYSWGLWFVFFLYMFLEFVKEVERVVRLVMVENLVRNRGIDIIFSCVIIIN